MRILKTTQAICRWGGATASLLGCALLSSDVSAGLPDQTILIKFESVANAESSQTRLMALTGAVTARPMYDLASARNPLAAQALGLDRWYEFTLRAEIDGTALVRQIGSAAGVALVEVPVFGGAAKTDSPDDP